MNILKQKGSTLVTGGNGYLGGLIIEALLRKTNRPLVVLARKGNNLENILEPIRIERMSRGEVLTTQDIERVLVLNYDSIESLGDVKESLIKNNVTEIIHSAGCVEYFNVEALEKVNVEMTERLLDLSNSISLDRFIFISTAYSCGYINFQSKETLHSRPNSDPTDYTRTKREAEWLVGNSGISNIIIRPSIVIGNSESGRYSGKRYGLYQQWMGLERLLCDRYHEEYHLVAPHQPVNFLHQDSFQNGFIGVYNNIEKSSVVHLTSNTNTAPTMRQLWELWLNQVARPKRVYYYPKLEDVPLTSIHSRQRAYLMFASVNLEIASHYWDFSTDTLTKLRSNGMEFTDATLESVALCQKRFVNSSERIKKFISSNNDKTKSSPEIVELSKAIHCQAV